MLTRLVDVTLERRCGLKIFICKSSPYRCPAMWVSSSKVRDYGEERKEGREGRREKGAQNSDLPFIYLVRGFRQGL